jgi:hypothetical protein
VEVGGPATLVQSLRAVALGGRISIVGVLAGTAGGIDFMSLFQNQATLQPILVGNRIGLEEILKITDHHSIKPIIDHVFEFDDTPAALRHPREDNQPRPDGSLHGCGPSTRAGFDVKFLAAHGKQAVLEALPRGDVSVAEFPSFAALRTWYDSPEYRDVARHRFFVDPEIVGARKASTGKNGSELIPSCYLYNTTRSPRAVAEPLFSIQWG